MGCAAISDTTRLSVLRLSFPYGPGQQSGLIHDLSACVLSGRPVSLNTDDGRPRVSPLFIDDCCRAVGVIAERRLYGIYNCGGAEHVSIRELTDLIGAVLGMIPKYVVDGNPCTDLLVDSSSLQKASTWRPTICLREGLGKGIRKIMTA